MWRYREVLPVENDENVVTLGEGGRRYFGLSGGAELGLRSLTSKMSRRILLQSFKPAAGRPLCQWPKNWGLGKWRCLQQGNAAGAWLLIRRGPDLRLIFMPGTRAREVVECEQTGAHVTDGWVDY